MPNDDALPPDRLVVIAPGLVGPPGGDSVLRSATGPLAVAAAESNVIRLAPTQPAANPDEAWLGLPPGTLTSQPGPLVVASLGAEPPERSVQFVLSWLGLHEAFSAAGEAVPTVEELRLLAGLIPSLETKRLKAVLGTGAEHGLVWEDGSLDLGTTPACELLGESWRNRLPEGDGERILRAFIDDGVNLLMEQEFNVRRLDEGLPALALLWPWGQGLRPKIPNLALRRGRAAAFATVSTVFAGLVRLAGYKALPLGGRMKGMLPAPAFLADLVHGDGVRIMLWPNLEEARSTHRLDFIEEALHAMAGHVLAPVMARPPEKKAVVSLIAPGPEGGLALTYVPGNPAGQGLPFDERLLEYGDAPAYHAWEAVAALLS